MRKVNLHSGGFYLYMVDFLYSPPNPLSNSYISQARSVFYLKGGKTKRGADTPLGRPAFKVPNRTCINILTLTLERKLA